MRKEINSYFDKLKTAIDLLDRSEIENFINILINARNNNKRIYIMGNGGSGASAGHFCCDFNKGMSYGRDKRFRMFCLNDNISTMMAYANDVSYEDIFVEQLKNFLEKDDVVIAISGSGNSKNVIKAIEYANKFGGITIGLTGFDGGKLKQIARYSVNTNVNDMQITEDLHMMLCHMIYSVLTNSTKDINSERLINI